MAVSVQTAERRIEKSAQAFRTISEVASELDVPQHVLRFWESKFSQVRPLKRGGGRRYYRPEDIDLLRRIRTLLYEDGYTIKGVQRLLKGGRGRLPQQQRIDLAAESALENLRIVSARAEARRLRRAIMTSVEQGREVVARRDDAAPADDMGGAFEVGVRRTASTAR